MDGPADHLFVIAGGTGDLAARKLVPAIHHLSRQGAFRPAWQFRQGLPPRAGAQPLLCVTPWNQIVLTGGTGAWLRLFDPEGSFHALFNVPHDPVRMTADLLAIQQYYESK